MHRMPRRAVLLLLALPLLVASAAPAAPDTRADRKAEKAAIEALPGKYRQWLEEVALLITDDERKTFLEIEKDYQRDAFIDEFWKTRDPIPSTARNELKERWNQRLVEVRSLFGDLTNDRSRIFLLNGPPLGRIESRCSNLWPLEVWYYRGSDRGALETFIIFVRKWGAGPFRIWYPTDGLDDIFSNNAASSGRQSLGSIVSSCQEGDRIAGAIGWVLNQGFGGYGAIMAKVEAPPGRPKGEWVSTFNSYSTEVPPGAETFQAQVELGYPGRHQSRTVLQGLVTVQLADVTLAQVGEHRSYNFLLTGEVVHDDKLFDNFRYKFDLPVTEGAEGQAPSAPLIFERYLRPGDYTLTIKIEDVNGNKFYRSQQVINVPKAEKQVARTADLPPMNEESARLLAEANRLINTGDTTIELIEPIGDLHTGMMRFDTLTTGDEIAKVTFGLDGKQVLTKQRPPYSVELDLGSIPRTHTLSVVAFDAAGAEVASDELILNAGGHRFAVDLIEPKRGKRYESSLRAEAKVELPEGQTVERLEFYWNETLVATLYQEPWTFPILLPKNDEIAYVRAVAYLPDGNSTEELVYVNAPEYMSELKVQFVELYTSVFDRRGRPVEGLTQADFSVTEDGTKQEIVRFERVSDLPIYAGILLDTSASMDGQIEEARDAALAFFQQALTPKDRATLLTFNDRPNLAVKFSNDVKTLAGGLAGLKAERGTSLYDSVVFALHYFNGIKGQRAILVLSDGKDESSKFSYEDTLDYARRAGVTIYTIGLGGEIDKRKLGKLAEDTGGRSFFVADAGELAPIYAEIQAELRSKYLIGYQSTNASPEGSFRSVDLKVAKPGLEVKTIRGYYP